LSQAVNRLSRVAILWNGDNPAKSREIVETAAAARQLGITVERIPVRGVAPDLHGAFSIMQRRKIQATIVLGDAYTFGHRQAIATLANSGRVPTMWELRALLDTTGALMSYGPDLNDLFRRSATYVDRILRGTKPADLPVEQPTKFELAINLKTAKAIGLTIPPALLQLADQVIE
jgi:putative ABC transport system substrate-binding protein